MPGRTLKRRTGSAKQISPLALLLALLAVLFCVEMIFMFAFDTALRKHASVWVVAVVDAVLLAAVASLGAWRLFVRPLQAALSGEAAYARAVFDAATEAIITIDAQGAIAGFNPAAERMFGYTAAEVTGRNVALLVHGDQAHGNERFVSCCFAANREGQRPRSREWTGTRKDGTEMPVEVDLTVLSLSGATRCTCFIRDIAERKRIEESTRLLAYHDVLTGLPNRALFYDRLRQSIALSKRHQHRFALLYLDLDGFKAVNDTLGHDAGDQLLKSAAQRVRGVVRESDTVARMGGDEFIVILSRSGGRATVARVARKIIRAIAVPFKLAGCEREVAIGGSVGIAVYPDDGEEIDALVKAADAAMYHAKRTRGSYCFAGHEETAGPPHFTGQEGKP